MGLGIKFQTMGPYTISAKVTIVTCMRKGINTPEVIITIRGACFEWGCELIRQRFVMDLIQY